MSVIFILIACSLLLAVSFLLAYVWASRSGQFEDDYTPSVRMLFEDEADQKATKLATKATSAPEKHAPNSPKNEAIKP